jgi:tetratricopeptide (TPR) repeat protein
MDKTMTIPELLEAGLHHYGLGEIDKALSCWREVLKRDPGNETAAEYIEIETGRPADVAAGPSEDEILELEEVVEEQTGPAAPMLGKDFLAGQMFLSTREPEKAIFAFEAAHRSNPDNPLHWAHVELSRASLIKEVIARAGGPHQPLRLKASLTDLIGAKDFTQEEGFVLSLITGDLGLEDLVALSPLPRYKTYEIVYRLFQEGLAEAGTAS